MFSTGTRGLAAMVAESHTLLYSTHRFETSYYLFLTWRIFSRQSFFPPFFFGSFLESVSFSRFSETTKS